MQVDPSTPLATGNYEVQIADLAARFSDIEKRCTALGLDMLRLRELCASEADDDIDPAERTKAHLWRTPTARSSLVTDMCGLEQVGKSLLERLKGANLTPMHIAATCNYVALARWLTLEKPELIDKPATGPHVGGVRPLHYACQKGYLEVARILVAAGAHLRAATTDHGYAPIHYAAQYGHRDIVAYLQTCGSEDAELPCETTKNGATALHIACINGRWPVAREILSRGRIHSGHLDTHLNTACRYGSALKELRLLPDNPLEPALLLGDFESIPQIMQSLKTEDQQRYLKQLFQHYPEKTYGPMFNVQNYLNRQAAREKLVAAISPSHRSE